MTLFIFHRKLNIPFLLGWAFGPPSLSPASPLAAAALLVKLQLQQSNPFWILWPGSPIHQAAQEDQKKTMGSYYVPAADFARVEEDIFLK